MNILMRLLIAIVLLILTMGTGFFMSSLSQPDHHLLFTVHILIAVVATVNMVFFNASFLSMGLLEFPIILLLVVGGLSVLAVFGSGIMLGSGKMGYNKAVTAHMFSTVLSIITMGIFLYHMVWGSLGGSL